MFIVRRNGYVASFFLFPILPCLSMLLPLINKKFKVEQLHVMLAIAQFLFTESLDCITMLQ